MYLNLLIIFSVKIINPWSLFCLCVQSHQASDILPLSLNAFSIPELLPSLVNISDGLSPSLSRNRITIRYSLYWWRRQVFLYHIYVERYNKCLISSIHIHPKTFRQTYPSFPSYVQHSSFYLADLHCLSNKICNKIIFYFHSCKNKILIYFDSTLFHMFNWNNGTVVT